MKIVVASDHGGFGMKKQLVEFLVAEYHDILDAGCENECSVDYPDFAHKAIEMFRKERCDFVILICGSGIGMSMVANKHKGIRCALCTHEYEAEMTRRHNNANALALGGRVVGIELAKRIVKTFLLTEFEGGRHYARIDKITELERQE